MSRTDIQDSKDAARIVEGASFTSAQVADIVGEFSEAELANYIKRYDPFPHKIRGRGLPIYFQLDDIMKLAAAALLIKKAGIPPAAAFAAVVPFSGPYGSMLHDSRGQYPGTSTFTQNADGRWSGADGPDRPFAIQIRAWPIFEKIFPRMKKVMIARVDQDKAPVVKKALADFEDQIKKLRKERWEE